MSLKIRDLPKVNDCERVELLFEYTKFHIGIRISLASILVGTFGFSGSPRLYYSADLLIVSVVLIIIAGFAGETIVSRLKQFTRCAEFWFVPTGPRRLEVLTGERLTNVEHTAFWIGPIGAFAAFLLPWLELW